MLSYSWAFQVYSRWLVLWKYGCMRREHAPILGPPHLAVQLYPLGHSSLDPLVQVLPETVCLTPLFDRLNEFNDGFVETLRVLGPLCFGLRPRLPPKDPERLQAFGDRFSCWHGARLLKVPRSDDLVPVVIRMRLTGPRWKGEQFRFLRC